MSELNFMREEAEAMREDLTIIEVCNEKARCQKCGAECSNDDYGDWSWCPHCGREIKSLQAVANFEGDSNGND